MALLWNYRLLLVAKVIEDSHFMGIFYYFIYKNFWIGVIQMKKYVYCKNNILISKNDNETYVYDVKLSKFFIIQKGN